MRKIFLVAVISLLSILFLGLGKGILAQTPDNIPLDKKYEGVVVKIIQDDVIEVFAGNFQPYQKVEVEITNGDLKGEKVTAELGKIAVANEEQKLKIGDKILLSQVKKIDGKDVFYVEDFVRRIPLYFLVALFVLAVVIVGGLRGFTSFLGLIVTFIILLKYIIPRIVAGDNPVFVSVVGSFFILLTTLYLAHGISRKTTAAVLGTTLSLMITAFLAWFFVDFTQLSGFVSEQAAFLNIFPGVKLNLQGILLGGIIIGSLGVLDDITVSQSACVFELHNVNKNLSWVELYKRGLRIGKDHIASLVNTLVLAYAGASLPLFLLFTLNGGEPFNILLNREMVASEVVRTLVGSLGLISAVPITTAIAASFIKLKSVKTI